MFASRGRGVFAYVVGMDATRVVVIVRHGKAEEGSPTGRDFDRGLKNRGRRQAAFLAEELPGAVMGAGASGIGRVVSSAAVRAMSTAGVIAAGSDVGVDTDERLLVGEPASRALGVVEEHVTDVEGALVIAGHNPQLSELVGLLSHGVGGVVGLSTGEAYVLRVRLEAPASGAEVVAVVRGEVGG